jgi:hypothetical protein
MGPRPGLLAVRLAARISARLESGGTRIIGNPGKACDIFSGVRLRYHGERARMDLINSRWQLVFSVDGRRSRQQLQTLRARCY